MPHNELVEESSTPEFPSGIDPNHTVHGTVESENNSLLCFWFVGKLARLSLTLEAITVVCIPQVSSIFHESLPHSLLLSLDDSL